MSLGNSRFGRLFRVRRSSRQTQYSRRRENQKDNVRMRSLKTIADVGNLHACYR